MDNLAKSIQIPISWRNTGFLLTGVFLTLLYACGQNSSASQESESEVKAGPVTNCRADFNQMINNPNGPEFQAYSQCIYAEQQAAGKPPAYTGPSRYRAQAPGPSGVQAPYGAPQTFPRPRYTAYPQGPQSPQGYQPPNNGFTCQSGPGFANASAVATNSGTNYGNISQGGTCVGR